MRRAVVVAIALCGLLVSLSSVDPARAEGAAGLAVYSDAQAKSGKAIYAATCASCHGFVLEGTTGPALTGPAFQQLASAQQLTAESLLAVITQSMPQSQPGSLSAEQYAAVTAYLLQQAGFPSGEKPLAAGDPQLSRVSLGK